MKMKPYLNIINYGFTLLIVFLLSYSYSFSQCAPAPTPTASTDCTDCTSTVFAATLPFPHIVSAGAGQIVCLRAGVGIPPLPPQIDLIGGIVRICESVEIRNINGLGEVVIEPSVTVSYVAGGGGLASFSMFGNTILTNYGELRLHSIFMSNSNNKVYNYGAISGALGPPFAFGQLDIQGTNNYVYNYKTFLPSLITLNSPTAFLINGENGFIDTKSMTVNAGFMCVEESSFACIRGIVNNQNSFMTFGSAGGTAIVSSPINLTLNATNFANNSNISLCLPDAVDGTSGIMGFGSATLILKADCPISCSGVILPVELLNFNIKVLKEEYVEVIWETTSEIDNDYFVIENSKDGNSWKEKARHKGQKESVQKLAYSFIDKEPHKGLSYYRLKQVDFDGQHSYSKIKAIRLKNSNKKEVIIFPNPATNEITISGDSEELDQFSMYNLLGQNVSHSMIFLKKETSSLTLDLSKLPSGIYILKTKTKSYRIHKD